MKAKKNTTSATPRNPWFRIYNEVIDDPKILLLALEDRWHYIAILTLKNRGELDDCEPAFMRRKVAIKLGVEVRTLDEIARRLAEVSLIDAETLQPLAWDDRQFQSDSSKARVEAWRARQGEQKQAVEDGNGDVTLQGCYGNGDVTCQEEEEEEDEHKDKKNIRSAGKKGAGKNSIEPPEDVSIQVWSDFEAHRKALKAPITPTVVRQITKEIDKAKKGGISANDLLAETMMRGWRAVKAGWVIQTNGSGPAGRPGVNGMPARPAQTDYAGWKRLGDEYGLTQREMQRDQHQVWETIKIRHAARAQGGAA